MKYRAEIDGLRAIAVIPVILFHAGFELFSGGFVGVDIFFVISGYLITTIILTELEQNTFSLVNFYERRARRILPALFLVMIASLPFAWFWLFSADMKSFSESLIAVSSFTSNILFWHQAGYWDTASELKPLLHTWSLAVEEQYYLLFPLFLLLMWRFNKRIMLSTFLFIATASLIVSQWGTYTYPSASFFLLPARGWELMIGACIALYFLYRNQAPRTRPSFKPMSESMGVIGLLMIGYATFGYDKTLPFPGLYALVPAIGTGLIIIFSSSQTVVGRLLGTKAPVGIGLISYSAYLWHQPLLAFARHRSLTEPSEPLLAALAVLAFPLAFLSWKYVEKPFRKKDHISRNTIFILSIAGSLLFMGIGMAGYLTDGFANRTTKGGLTYQSLQEKLKLNSGLSKTCEWSFTTSPDCNTSDSPEILIWGDSFAMHLVQGILASNPDAKITQMTKSLCGPFFEIAPMYKRNNSTKWASGCLEFTQKLREWLQANDTIKYAVVSSLFSGYISESKSILHRSGDIAPANIDTAASAFLKTLRELQSMGITPIIFSPPPETGANLGQCLARAAWNGSSLSLCDFDVAEISKGRLKAYDFLDRIKQTFPVVRLDHLICENTICKTHINSTFLYRDSGHFSHEGSAALGEKYNFYHLITNNPSRQVTRFGTK